MAVTMRKLSNKNQIEKLVEIMKNDSNIAKGLYKKSQILPQWNKYAETLNSLGPPVKSAEKWLKVWTDFKFNVKKKLIHNTKEIKSTGGGRNTLYILNPLEEAVVEILDLKTSVDPPGKDFGVNTNNNNNINEEYVQGNIGGGETAGEDCATVTDTTALIETHITDADITISEDVANEMSTATPRERASRKRSGRTSSIDDSTSQRMQLLHRQTQSQEKFYAEMLKEIKEIKQHVKESCAYKKKLYYLRKDTNSELLKIKKQKLEIYKKEVENKAKDRMKKLQLKFQILELQKQLHTINEN